MDSILSNDLAVLGGDALKLGEAIATALVSGNATATLDPIEAKVANATLDVSAKVAISEGSTPNKPSVVNDAIRLGEALAEAFTQGTGTATLDPFGVSFAGKSLVFAATVTASKR
jgi:hypothetical protein